MTEDEIRLLTEVSDRAAIRATLNRYSRGVDRHDSAFLSSVFFEDSIDNHGDFVAYAPEFYPYVNELHDRICAFHCHNLTTQLIALHSETEAEAETYVLFALKRKDGITMHIGGGRYLDRLEKRGGLWRIATRRVALDWRFDVRGDGSMPHLSENQDGTWDFTDPSYAIIGPDLGVLPARI